MGTSRITRRMKPVGVAALAVAVGVGGSSCSMITGEGPEEAADALAADLSQHRLTVPLTEPAAAKSLRGATADVRDHPVTVEVGAVTENEGEGAKTATATLDWSWDLGEHDWTYRTDVDLVEREQGWLVDWRADDLAPKLQRGEKLDVDAFSGRRGKIMGANGLAVVRDRAVLRYGLDKSQAKKGQWAASASRIARAVGVDVAGFRKQVEAYGDKAFVEAIVLRAEDAREQIDDSYSDIPGAVALPDTLPLAPTREFAAPVLGAVGEATAEVIKQSRGKVKEGDEVGLSGLQLRYDDQLRGGRGVTVEAVRSDGAERELFRAGGDTGKDLQTTLDIDLQNKAEQALSAHVGESGPASALVAIKPSTGEILAAANGPGNGGLNAATAGQYAPGSTFKVVSALALLRAGLTPESAMQCPATTVVDGRSFKNYDDYPSSALGEVTLREAIANSCNTAMIDARTELGNRDLADAAASLGLGVDHDLGFTAYFGQVPPAETETGRAADMIGQGTVLAGPMAMAGVAASVAAGKTVLPTLLPDHQVTQKKPATPLTAKESEQLRGLMRAVVTEGSGSFLAGLPGNVGAKTGTAEYGEPAADGSLPTHAWMIATQGDLAVAVFVEEGESGSQTAGPILQDFLR